MLSILYLLISLIPVLVYVGIIYLTTTWKSIKFSTSMRYFLTGSLSIGILLTFFDLFPKFQVPLMGNDFFSPLFILTFFQVALLEETCKFLSFNISEKIRGERQKKDIPVATMFYCGISALGFAFLENIGYAHKFGGSVILLRSLSAMIVHFLCGMIMGYWVSLSRIPSKLDNRSFVEVLFIKKPKVKKWTYSIIGIICASIFHGMFDYNIESGGNPIDNYIIILGGIIAVYIGSKNLNEKYRN